MLSRMTILKNFKNSIFLPQVGLQTKYKKYKVILRNYSARSIVTLTLKIFNFNRWKFWKIYS